MRILSPAELRGLDTRGLEALLGHRAFFVSIGEDDVRGLAAAALLFADFAVLRDGAVLHLDHPLAWGGAAWRLGERAYRLHLQGRVRLTNDEAIAEGLCDAREWSDLEHRSALALESAAGLIRMRGGDAVERAEFARLFAIGEPQEGLAAFLEKRRPRFTK